MSDRTRDAQHGVPGARRHDGHRDVDAAAAFDAECAGHVDLFKDREGGAFAAVADGREHRAVWVRTGVHGACAGGYCGWGGRHGAAEGRGAAYGCADDEGDGGTRFEWGASGAGEGESEHAGRVYDRGVVGA